MEQTCLDLQGQADAVHILLSHVSVLSVHCSRDPSTLSVNATSLGLPSRQELASFPLLRDCTVRWKWRKAPWRRSHLLLSPPRAQRRRWKYCTSRRAVPSQEIPTKRHVKCDLRAVSPVRGLISPCPALPCPSAYSVSGFYGECVDAIARCQILLPQYFNGAVKVRCAESCSSRRSRTRLRSSKSSPRREQSFLRESPPPSWATPQTPGRCEYGALT